MLVLAQPFCSLLKAAEGTLREASPWHESSSCTTQHGVVQALACCIEERQARLDTKSANPSGSPPQGTETSTNSSRWRVQGTVVLHSDLVSSHDYASLSARPEPRSSHSLFFGSSKQMSDLDRAKHVHSTVHSRFLRQPLSTEIAARSAMLPSFTCTVMLV